MVRYQLQRRQKFGRYSELEDPAFRSRCISIASTGMSRRGVAAAVGVDPGTIRNWIGKGKAFPGEEPWGSFAVDYERAERGLEGAAVGTISLTVQRLFELSQRAANGDTEAGAILAEHGPQMKELLNVLASRFPRDWGTSKHREPDVDFSADEYLDANAMTREQLGAVFADPPEKIRQALADQAHAVYRILVESGFDPGAPARKATDDDGSEHQGMAGIDEQPTRQHGVPADDEGEFGGAD